ncbi:MAG TPA: SAM-dependent methyltransferase [Chitinophagales bacterium]|jgi:16S rRNA (cytidine1402-2'-O)-methyltransferase|nr:SAM-dependent methyltransferase [Chitinophagales bacterium]HQD11337.1 SAM-dependent methyltransferase [Chitinophagales bacterium]HQO30629.1 SAM-dependent methyltransferase [Chitinophagales bacterium]
MQNGVLYLIPTVIADNSLGMIPPDIREVIIHTNIYIVENIKTARRFIKAVYKEKNIDDCTFVELDKHQNYRFDDSILTEVFQGKNIGLMSEAGVPCIADPGNKVVEAAHEMDITVVPLSGPSAIIMALMASGFNGQQFTFNGYLPIETGERKGRLQQMESLAKKGITQIFMDTPYRNQKLLDEIISICKFDTMLCIACNITAQDEFIKTLPLSEWKKRKPDLNKKPAIFVLGK